MVNSSTQGLVVAADEIMEARGAGNTRPAKWSKGHLGPCTLAPFLGAFPKGREKRLSQASALSPRVVGLPF